MDGHRHADPLTDESSLDREIESMMAVEPSPQFVARVRARVAQEPEPGRWRASWLFAPAGAVAIVIVAVIAWPSLEPVPSSVAPVESPRVAEAVALSSPPAAEIERPQAAPRAAPAIHAREAATLTPMVSADDARAFDRLLSAARQDEVVIVFNDDMPNSALSTSTLAVAPITIEPVTVPEPLEGGVE